MMRLRRLDLTRFGHFTDHHIDLGPTRPGEPDFHIIYGPNEAGKSTLMEAYLRLIYGFPVRDPYGFKHPLPTLQVGGLIEVNGTGTELVRVKKTANSLQDRHGDAIPETILQSSLGGVTEAEYRKLFCLDDATIEAGGDEITNSKGEIGKLLFSAAAGIGNLTGVLDQVAARAEAFYKKNASKTTFSGLKRDLDSVSAEIKALDIPATQYRHLRTALDGAKAAETAARAAKDALERRKSHLSALIAAQPIAAELRIAEADLQPVAHYPAAIDIDPELLVVLMTARVAFEAARDQQTAIITDAAARRSTLDLRPDIIALRDHITALDPLRGRMEGALADLPIRTADRDAALATMRGKLGDMGLDPGADPTRFVLPDHLLRRLEQALRMWSDAEGTLVRGITEERQAQLVHQTSTTHLKAAEGRVTTGPEIEDVLTRFGAAQCVEEHRAAQQHLTLLRVTAAERLRDLTRGNVQFATLPSVTLTSGQADTLATDMLKADQVCDALAHAHDLGAERLARAQALLGHLAATPNLVTDDIALARRAERDTHWEVHRAALDAATADAFADAMGRDDAATALRQTQARHIAAYQQATLTTTEAEIDLAAAQTRLDAAISASAALDATRAAHLHAIGLPADLTAADVTNWLRQLDAAHSAASDVQTALDTTNGVRTTAEALRVILAALPGMDPAGDLDSLFRAATARLDTSKAQLATVLLARSAVDKDAVALTLRQAARQDAQIACDATATAWQVTATSALPPDTPLVHLRAALPSLRSLREINETVVNLTRQIDGMVRDKASFVAGVAPLMQALGGPPDQPSMDIYRSAKEALATAEKTQDTWGKLTDSIADAQVRRDTATAEISTQDRQLRALAAGFDPAIPTASLQDLRSAVLTGQSAIRLRSRIATLTTTLCAGLGVARRGDADAMMMANPLDDAMAAFNSLADDMPRATKAVEAAIEIRTKAQGSLDLVQGDADIARLVARQRTIEVDIQDGSLRYLEDRFAHMLAERAIRRYRDTHRNGMLVATEAAFRTLTNGAYGALTTVAEGTAEALVAIHAPTGSTKQARDMSKGTRFQLYLALRAAAYDQMAANGTILPFFCDDIFETFDETRTTAACGLMQQIGQRGQAIYLTHHKHVVDIAQALCGDRVRIHNLDP